MTPEELMAESERLLMEASRRLGQLGNNFHITPIQRDQITSLAMTGHGLAALARVRMEAEGRVTEYAVIPPEPRDWVKNGSVIRRCGHQEMCLRHQGAWLHPFSLTVCNMPPSGAPDRPTKTVIPPAPKEAP
jgi:hypothetical protein